MPGYNGYCVTLFARYTLVISMIPPRGFRYGFIDTLLFWQKHNIREFFMSPFDRIPFRLTAINNDACLICASVVHIVPRGGGGGTRDIYWWGCALAHQKRGVLCAGTAPKKGGLMCGHNQNKGGLRHVYNPKKWEFRTDLVKRVGAYLFIIFTFTCQYDQLVGVCSGRLKRGGS